MTSDEQYIEMCRLEDKYTKIPTTWEVSKIFPGCRDIVMRLVYDLNKHLSKYDEWIKKEPFNKYIRSIDKDYVRLIELKKFLKFTRTVEYHNKIDVESAKSIPIIELYDFIKPRFSRNRIQTFCPFHNENNPSFFIYTKNNQFHCFSCCEHGDSIAFIQRINGLDFVSAVKFLNKWIK